ncbi:atrial natriuretic peptide-converting enzyme-like isoform X3 [Octopus vulgaris]|uniref:Atrial natriuretic peptide-converting enzyme-like isoform X3 n=1 Tax=Octopus vulgaris TaxID=6645 RepID=A0AA36AUZ7_OCTVU|nr:atrial natriuretic peptide-converting enzyme-like isoform X3 [Octopus vulgaris]CAI9722760.1 atrial natriuretic peptide-converting enzyme-like isoform X3 [Octopus vulgaris]
MKLSIFVHVILVLPLFLNKIEANMQLRHESENKAVFFEPLGHSHIGLVGNSSFYNAGLISIYRNNSWGYVCDDNWDMMDANVACKQLGFSRGAEVATGNSRYGLAESENFLMDNTDCKGDERALQYCSYDTEHDCKKDEAAGVICKPNTGCKPGWISGPSGCYHLFSGNIQRLNAKEMCDTEDSHLVIIDSLEEDAFLSVLLQTNNDNHVWLTDGFKNGRNWEWNYQRETISTFYWFPGWIPNKKSAEPSKRGRCISLSNVFEYDGELHITSYFFWKTSNCSSVTGFICEQKKTPDFTEECYSGNGVSYRGSVSETGKGTPCLKWTENPKYNTINSPNAGLGDHNFCRNPDDDERPWCWVAPAFQNQFGYCKIDQCKNVTESTTVESTVTTYPTTVASTTPTTKPKPTCSPVQMLCKGSNTCISLVWRCDGERDCIRGDDEENCHCYSGNGVSYRGSVSETDGGTPCLKWTENPKYNTTNSPNAGIGDHNFCRNPDDDKRPWCWVAPAFQNKFGYCKIDQCKNVTESTTVESTVTTFPTTVASTTRNISCNSDKMLCSVSSRKCIPISWKCDGEADCPDSEDEKDCELEVSCASNSMMCPSRKICIPLQWKCDGDRDCPEGEDESKCDIVTTTKATVTTTKATVTTTQAPVTTTLSLDCPDNEMYCAATNTCISLSWKCDGENDCPNGEDEKDCGCHNSVTVKSIIMYYLGSCILLSWKCDGENDCPNGEDEKDCDRVTTTQAPVTTTLSLDCQVNEMYCTYTNTCILLSWKCDGENDCPNGEDEKDCDIVTTTRAPVTTTQAPVTTTLSLDCEVNEMYCTSTKTCILLSWKCDGENDCPNGEDEKDCVIVTTTQAPVTIFPLGCSANEMYCSASKTNCIPLAWKCDGQNDCPDGEDEEDCDRVTTTQAPVTTTLSLDCRVNEMYCTATKSCILLSWKCDGQNDCPDGEDEKDCDYTLDNFEKQDTSFVIHAFPKEFYVRIPLETCAKNCLYHREFVCKAFHYYEKDYQCKLFDTMKSLSLRPLSSGSYYVLSQKCTSTDFQCDNGRCIPGEEKCNGRDNCNDFSDEQDCGIPETLEIRLADGEEHSGRVEIKYLNEWGVVCDDKWDINDANVVCRMLGYKSAIKAIPFSNFGPGNANFLLTNVECIGNETSLLDCPKSPWRQHNCKRHETASVICKANKGCPPNQFECDNSQCRSIKYICDRVDNCGDNSDEKYCTASVKLVNGTNPSNGRIQITINNITGTICDDNFNNIEATVICKQLGYKSGIALPGGTYGKGNGIIWYDEVNCYGNENSIEFCNGNTKGEHDCDHTEDVGVQCYRDAITTTTFPTTTTVASTTTVAPVCGKVSHQIKTKYANRAIDKPFYSKLVNEDTAYGMYPWQVAVEHITGAYSDFYYSTEYFCGGTILHNDWIISAAHCFVGKKKESLIIKVGDHNKKIWDTYEQTFKVAELIIHAKYDDNSYDYDIALIKIEPNRKGNGIVFNDYVQPACLPDKNTTYFESERCHISGWGNTGKAYPSILKAATVPLIEAHLCKAMYKNSITPRMICAGYVEGGLNSCQGDDGGPLVCNIDGVYTLTGVTSWGNGCGHPRNPGVYTNVLELQPWIEYIMKKYS